MYKWVFSECLKVSGDEHRRIASGRVFQARGPATAKAPSRSVERRVAGHVNAKCAARGWLKMQDQKSRQKSPSGHHRTTLSGYIFATKAHIDNRKKKLVKQQYLLYMSAQYGELRPTSG